MLTWLVACLLACLLAYLLTMQYVVFSTRKRSHGKDQSCKDQFIKNCGRNVEFIELNESKFQLFAAKNCNIK